MQFENHIHMVQILRFNSQLNYYKSYSKLSLFTHSNFNRIYLSRAEKQRAAIYRASELTLAEWRLLAWSERDCVSSVRPPSLRLLGSTGNRRLSLDARPNGRVGQIRSPAAGGRQVKEPREGSSEGGRRKGWGERSSHCS